MGWGDAVKMTVMLTDESQVALYRAARDAAMGDVKCTLRPPPPAGCPQRRQSCLVPACCWLRPDRRRGCLRRCVDADYRQGARLARDRCRDRADRGQERLRPTHTLGHLLCLFYGQYCVVLCLWGVSPSVRVHVR